MLKHRAEHPKESYFILQYIFDPKLMLILLQEKKNLTIPSKETLVACISDCCNNWREQSLTFSVPTRTATAHQCTCVSCRACFAVNGTYNQFSVEVQNLKRASIIDRPKISRNSQELINTKMHSMTAFPFRFKDTHGKMRSEYLLLRSMNSKAGREESI